MAVRITRAGVGLTIGIIILGLAVLGGLYLVKQRGEEARRDQAIQIAQQNLESQSNNGTAPTSDGSNSSSSTNNGSNSSNNSSNNGSQNTSNLSNSNGSTSSNTATPNTSTELPQTGPTEQWGSALALALLTFSIAAYMVSKQQLRDSL